MAGSSPHGLASATSNDAPGPDLVVTNAGTPFAQVSYLTNRSTRRE